MVGTHNALRRFFIKKQQGAWQKQLQLLISPKGKLWTLKDFDDVSSLKEEIGIEIDLFDCLRTL